MNRRAPGPLCRRLTFASAPALIVVAVGACCLAAACGEGGTVAVQGQLAMDRAALDFGEVPVLSRREVSVALTNAGRGPLALFDFRIEPSTAPVAIVDAPAAIASGASADLTLAYAPAALGELSAALRFATDDADRAEVEVPLSGRSSTQGRLDLTTALDFAGVCEGGVVMG